MSNSMSLPPPTAPNRLRRNLAAEIIALMREQACAPGYHLVENEICQHFGVSRTPVRAALNLLAEAGVVEHRANRGFVLVELPAQNPPEAAETDEVEEDNALFVAIAQAHLAGSLPRECTQQELVRLFSARLPVVVRVLRQLSDLGLVERKRGNGWSFVVSIDSDQTQRESYRFRSIIEPALLREPSFALTADWVEEMRAEHEAFAELKWRDTLAVEFYEMNARFHIGLAEACGNRYFHQAMEQQNRLRRFLNYGWEFGIERVRASIREHIAILDALESGDKNRAALLMELHLDEARETPPQSKKPDVTKAAGR